MCKLQYIHTVQERNRSISSWQHDIKLTTEQKSLDVNCSSNSASSTGFVTAIFVINNNLLNVMLLSPDH